MRRFIATPLLTFLLAACSGSDSVLGAKGEPEAAPFARVDLGTLGGASSYAAAINNGNMVVGWSQTASGATHAFRWTPADGMIDLGTLPGDDMSQAVAVLDVEAHGGGQILGVSGSNGRWTPVVWSISGSQRALPTTLIPGFTIALPSGFNARGDVIGSDAGGPDAQHAWVWSDAAGKYDLSANIGGGSHGGAASAITSSGLVLLTAQVADCGNGAQCARSYLWNAVTGYRPIGTPENESGVSVTGLGLSETGTVVGWLTQGTGAAAPYRWSAGSGFTMLANYAAADGRYGYAMAVSSGGTVVGADFDPASGSIVASRWSLDGAITKLSPFDVNPSVAVAINEQGTIAGWKAIVNGVNHAVIWQSSTRALNVVRGASMSVTADMNARSESGRPTSACLSHASSITSREALFSCVIEADRTR